MTVDAIKDAIAHLPEQERKQLADWIEEMEEQAWDHGRWSKDFAPGGRGAHLLEKMSIAKSKRGTSLSLEARTASAP